MTKCAKMKKVEWVYDCPVTISQKFKVYLIEGQIMVIRKEIQRQAHNTACDVADIHVEYEVWKEANIQERNKATEMIETFLKNCKK